MPTDNFWSNTGRVPGVPVIQDPYVEPAPADPNNPETSYYRDPVTLALLDPAHRHIPGTAKGSVPAEYSAAAQVAYPRFDGLTTQTQLPDSRPPELAGTGAPAAVDLATFAGWHSAFQAEYLTRLPAPGRLVFPSGSLFPAAQAIYRIGADGEVHNLKAMTVSDYAKLPDADKLSFQSDLITSQVAARLGLSASALSLHQLIELRRDDIRAASGISTTNENVFIDQLNLIANSLTTVLTTDGTGRPTSVVATEPNLFAVDAITSRIGDIMQRFDRALKFSAAPYPGFPSQTPVPPNYPTFVANYFGKTGSYSSEGNVGSANTTVRQGFEEFMRAERAILTMQNRREGLIGATFGLDPKLDVPNLIYRLQLTYEAQSEGIADSGTELIRQLHTLLQDYGVMQRLVNDQIKKYDPEEADQELAFNSLNSFTTKEKNVLAMFALDSAANPDRDHPIEAYYDIERPRETFFVTTGPSTALGGAIVIPFTVSPVSKRKTVWDQYSTQLADSVTLLNQRNQILQNEIENASKQQNRHFELGNNALRKMNDMLMTIGRM